VAVRTFAASLLSAVIAAALLSAAASAAWVSPTGPRILLRADASPAAPARAIAYRGERLRVTATRELPTGSWRLVELDGRSGWLAGAQARPVAAPRRWQHRCVLRAAGRYAAGRLLCGRLLPAQGTGYRTWDPVLSRSPNRSDRRWGTSTLLARIAVIGRRWQARHPLGARLLIGDLSRPLGGPFGPRFGGIGHASHQNGFDVDILYPSVGGLEREPSRPDQVDRRGALELVRMVARTSPTVVFVGCRIGLPTLPRPVRPLCRAHENHLHARYAP